MHFRRKSAWALRRFLRSAVQPIVLISICVVFLYSKMNAMAPTMSAIAADLGFDDAERDRKLGGDMNAAFFLLGAPLSFIHGYLADTTNRKNLFVVTVLISEIPCLFMGLVSEYWQLLVLRCLMGIGLGGVLPTSYSLLSDLYRPSQRATMSTILGSAMGLGLLAGQVVAGLMAPVFGWRMPFVVLAIPAIVFACLTFVLVEEPPRGHSDQEMAELAAKGQVYTERLDWESFRAVFRTKTNMLVFLQGMPGTVPWAVVFVYMNDFLAQERGLPMEHATLVVTMFGLGAALGGVGGGILGQYLYNKRRELLPLYMGGCTILGVLPMRYLLTTSFTPEARLDPLSVTFMAGALVNVAGNNIRALLLNVNSPETRGTAFCMANLANSIGRGAGPALISYLIRRLGARLPAFDVAIWMWLVCGCVILCMAATVTADEQRVRARMIRARAVMGDVEMGSAGVDMDVAENMGVLAGDGSGADGYDPVGTEEVNMDDRDLHTPPQAHYRSHSISSKPRKLLSPLSASGNSSDAEVEIERPRGRQRTLSASEAPNIGLFVVNEV